MYVLGLHFVQLLFRDEDLANSSPLLPAVEESAANWLPDSAKLQSVPTKKSAELQNAAQIMSQAVQHKNNGNVPPTLGNNNNNSSNTATSLNSSSSNNNSSNSHNATLENPGCGNAEMNTKLDQLMGKHDRSIDVQYVC